VPFGSIDRVKEGGIVCRSCSADADEKKVRKAASTLLRHHVAFGKTPSGEPYVMIGETKITDPNVVSQFETLREIFWGSK
jgi:hypothetical protein